MRIRRLEQVMKKQKEIKEETCAERKKKKKRIKSSKERICG